MSAERSIPSEPPAGVRTRPYGSWSSPIGSDLVATAQIRLGEMVLSDEAVYWIEGRPQEAGRNVLVRWASDGQPADLTAPPFDVRSRVHEYGGGSMLVADGALYFSNLGDHRLYRLEPGAAPQPISPPAAVRYADGTPDVTRRRLIAVAEDHTRPEREPVGSLVAVDLDGARPPHTLVAGADFYASPTLSPDGTRLAWLAWNHPNMPWDGTELWVADVAADGSLRRAERVAGGPSESIFQPSWAPDGVLYFVSDRTGWWNLYARRADATVPVLDTAAEFGRPQWVLGNPTYGFETAARLVCSYVRDGAWHLARLDTATGTLDPIPVPYTEIRHVHVSRSHVCFQGGAPNDARAIVRLDLVDGSWEVLARSDTLQIDPGYLSTPQRLTFPTTHGRTAYGFFYPPVNRDFAAPGHERPPLLVVVHGGPTGATSTTLDLELQFWTSRGIAVLDVDYGGSTGYGRGYRERLDGQWGVVDVDDCERGARHLVASGRVDGDRLAIRGASAGGYTALAALTFRDTFAVGASHYGVSDLEALTRDTHKFESRYLERLVGPYPDRRDLYVARSPVGAADRLSRPVIFFQGLDDRVVPPDQARRMVEALRRRGHPVAYLEFPGEQHGFRSAATIKRVLEAELYFYSRILGFDTDAAEVAPVPIENL